MLDGTHYFECQCGTMEHTLRFTLCLDDDDPGIYAEVCLYQWRHWWQRVWVALKYICGQRQGYGHFDCWMLVDQDATRLRDLCEAFLNRSSSSVK